MPRRSRIKLPRRIKLPKFNIIYVLVGVIVLFALILGFVLGVLITKVQYLERGVGTTGSQTANTTATAPDVTEPVSVDVGHLPPQGKANSKVKIIEFADLRCPYCEQFFTQTEPQILSDYVDSGKAAFYFRQYAFLGDASTVAANAAECANAQGKFWDFHDYIYKNQPPESDTSMFTVDKLSEIAGSLGMDSASFSSCLSAKTYQKNIDKDLSEGGNAGVSGTPTVFINGMKFAGACPAENFKQAIDYAYKGTKFSISGSDGCTVTAL